MLRISTPADAAVNGKWFHVLTSGPIKSIHLHRLECTNKKTIIVNKQ